MLFRNMFHILVYLSGICSLALFRCSIELYTCDLKSTKPHGAIPLPLLLLDIIGYTRGLQDVGARKVLRRILLQVNI